MNPIDKFNPGKWLTENKLTFQSRLVTESQINEYSDKIINQLIEKFQKEMRNTLSKDDILAKIQRFDQIKSNISKKIKTGQDPQDILNYTWKDLKGVIDTYGQINEENSDELMVAFKNSPKMIPWEKIEQTYEESGLTGDEFFAGFEDEFREQFEGKSVSKEAYTKFYNSHATGGQDDMYIMINWIDFTNPELANKLSNQM